MRNRRANRDQSRVPLYWFCWPTGAIWAYQMKRVVLICKKNNSDLCALLLFWAASSKLWKGAFCILMSLIDKNQTKTCAWKVVFCFFVVPGCASSKSPSCMQICSTAAIMWCVVLLSLFCPLIPKKIAWLSVVNVHFHSVGQQSKLFKHSELTLSSVCSSTWSWRLWSFATLRHECQQVSKILSALNYNSLHKDTTGWKGYQRFQG